MFTTLQNTMWQSMLSKPMWRKNRCAFNIDTPENTSDSDKENTDK